MAQAAKQRKPGSWYVGMIPVSPAGGQAESVRSPVWEKTQQQADGAQVVEGTPQERLEQVLKDFQQKLQLSLKEAGPDGAIDQQTFYDQLQASLNESLGGASFQIQENASVPAPKFQLPERHVSPKVAPRAMTPVAHASDKVQNVQTTVGRAAFVHHKGYRADKSGDLEEERLVSVVDVDEMEWWTIVNPGPDDEDDNDGDSGEGRDKEEPTTLDNEDAFVIVRDDDTLAALSEFVARSVAKYPKAKALAPGDLKKMLNGTFKVLQDQTEFGRLWSWGQFAYTTWGWTSFAINTYREPAMAKLVATGVWKAMSWVLVFVI